MLNSLGYIIDAAANDRAAVRLMEQSEIDLLVAGVNPSDRDALKILSYVRRKHREVPVILLFPRPRPEREKEALRLGAMAALQYPVPAADLRAAVSQALERSENRQTKAGGLAAGSESAVPVTKRTELVAQETGLVGADPSWRQVLDLARATAAMRSSVLIVGEPGTGKSVLARFIHALGSNPDRPFVTVQGAALANEVALPEGSGHGRPGLGNGMLGWPKKLKEAQGGTLYLDEVGALSIELQHRLLRELQSRDYEASAGHTMLGDLRFLISNRESLQGLVGQGRFRQELYHRVSAISLMLPPLRHRGTDIELLAQSFRSRYAHEFHKDVTGFSCEALELMQLHDWPGNVRELEAAVQRAVALCSGPKITPSHLAPILNYSREVRSHNGTTPRARVQIPIRGLKAALEAPEKRIIIQALAACNGNRKETAEVLGINRTTLYKKIKSYGLLIDEAVAAN
jgi:two-component system response regulator HydG